MFHVDLGVRYVTPWVSGTSQAPRDTRASHGEQDGKNEIMIVEHAESIERLPLSIGRYIRTSFLHNIISCLCSERRAKFDVMLPLINLLALCFAMLHVCGANGYVAVRSDRPSMEDHQMSARSNPRPIISTDVNRRQIMSTNNTFKADEPDDEDLDITCFRSSPELQLRRVRISDCARIIRDLSSTLAPDAELKWGTVLSKSPDYIIPYTLPPRGSCNAQINPWPPGSEHASDEFSTNYLGHVVKEIILACLTGDEPFGGTVVFGPQKYMRLTLSGPLPIAGNIEQSIAAGKILNFSSHPQIAPSETV